MVLFSRRCVFGNSLNQLIDRVGHSLRGEIEVVREDGEDDHLSGIGGGVSGERLHSAERPVFAIMRFRRRGEVKRSESEPSTPATGKVDL